jgi:hypothetical protein
MKNYPRIQLLFDDETDLATSNQATYMLFYPERALALEVHFEVFKKCPLLNNICTHQYFLNVLNKENRAI